METGNRIEKINSVLENWLRTDNQSLKYAIDRSVDEGYFSMPDIRHQVLYLKKKLSPEALLGWVQKNQLEPGELKGFKALCLHAGNIPLVGIQDLLACLITGVEYTGKISRKDPYLLPTLLEQVKKSFPDESVRWSVDIDALAGAKTDYVLFSGSSKSVKKVQERIHQLQLAKDKARYLIRTAYFSLAFIDSVDPETMNDLTEAVFRYGGKGCRSVAVVIAPVDYESIKCSFTDYVESFWIKNPQHEKPAPSLYYRYAYNKAVEISQSWLDDFLIEETLMKPEREFILHWIQGNETTVSEFVSRYGAGLQTVYVPNDGVKIPDLDHVTEDLSKAQSPPINWKPDGVDSIRWLMNP